MSQKRIDSYSHEHPTGSGIHIKKIPFHEMLIGDYFKFSISLPKSHANNPSYINKRIAHIRSRVRSSLRSYNNREGVPWMELESWKTEGYLFFKRIE